MIKLTGWEGSVLAFIARFPDSPEAKAKLKQLTGHAFEIGKAIRNIPVADGRHEYAGKAIQNWAKQEKF